MDLPVPSRPIGFSLSHRTPRRSHPADGRRDLPSEATTFHAIDFELANPQPWSICQIGIVRIRDGRIDDRWSALVNPHTWFEKRRIRLHGIDGKAVVHQPTIRRFRDRLRGLSRSVVVHHGGKEPDVLRAALARYGLPRPLEIKWLDSAQVAQRAWPRKYAVRGYGLAGLADSLGISVAHHDALEDAEAAAKVVLRACGDTGLDVPEWLERVARPIDFSVGQPPGGSRTHSEDGLLHGERVAVTGTLKLIPRHTLGEMDVRFGCVVVSHVTEHTTIVIVGESAAKTHKLIAAEELAARGHPIRVLTERDFVDLVESA